MARVVQIGVGHWGRNHKRILEDMDVLVATVDINGQEDYKRITDVKEKYDHVVICTPPDTHFKLVTQLIDKHIFVEKPLTLDSLQTAKLLLKTSKKLQVGMIERYNPIVQKIKKQGNKNLTFVREGPKQEHIKESIVWDTTIHDIDLAFWFFDEMPLKVVGSYTDTYCEMLLEFSAGEARIISAWDRPKHRSINGISTITTDNILKNELLDFINGYNVSWEQFEVARAIEEIHK